MLPQRQEGRPDGAGRPRDRLQRTTQAAHFSAAADDDAMVDNVAAGFKVDGACCVARSAAQGKGLAAILQNSGGDGDTHATRN
jgi:hypothetical protein